MTDSDAPTNWSTALPFSKLTTANTSQDVDLLAKSSFKLHPIKPLLQNGDTRFEAGHHTIMKAFQVNNLHRLVKIDCPGPVFNEDWDSDWF